MKKIALLLSDNLLPSADNHRLDIFELAEEEIRKLRPALAALEMELVEVRWREIADRAVEFDAILPLLVWDYFEGNEAAFLAAIARAEATTPVFNSFDLLKWNSDKSYLEDLSAKGAPVIRTLTVDGVTKANVARAFEALETDKLVIKPTVGGGAWRQVLHKKGDALPPAGELPPKAALLQAFLPSVLTEGEFSFLYFGGRFSHAIRKTPKSGDYRIQSTYGGTEEPYAPTPPELQTASDVLQTLEATPLYARVDLLRGQDGRLKLIELEMIEPYFYLPHAPSENADNLGAQNFARALAERLAGMEKT